MSLKHLILPEMRAALKTRVIAQGPRDNLKMAVCLSNNQRLFTMDSNPIH